MSEDDDIRIGYLVGEANGSLPAGEGADLDELRALLASPAVWMQPPASLEGETVAAIVEAARLRHAARNAHGRQSRRRHGWRVAGIALAGTLAAGLIASVIGLGAGGKRPRTEQLAMVVSGTALAPSARGTANLTRTASGWEIQLSVAGLPRLAGGRYYEGWLQDATGERVAVGTFNDARNVTLWAGVSPARFATLVVTVQRVGADPGDSRVRMLVGLLGTRRHRRP